jgi:hypothetical protein
LLLKRAIAHLLLAATILAASPGAASAAGETPGRLQVMDGPLNVRTAPSLSAAILTAVPLGTMLDVVNAGSEWSQVRLTGGRTGWIATRYTTPPPPVPSLDGYAPLLANDYGYLEVDGDCIGASPVTNGRLYVPLRAINDALGGETTWIDGKAGVRFGGRSLTITPGNMTAVLNGKEVTFDPAPFIAQDRTLVPIRPFTEALGLSLQWDAGRRTAILKSGAPGGGTACSPAAPLKAYMILDEATGLVLSESHPDERMPIASTTKMMTTLLAVERGELSRTVTVSARAANTPGTTAYLRAGERLSMQELLYGVMLPSGNDAAVAVAETLAGTEATFTGLMNQRARDLGANATLFYNASGLDDYVWPYSTARDLGTIARAALQNSEYRAFGGASDHVLQTSAGSRKLKNSNTFVTTYPGATGAKNGWTEKAGYTLVASAYRGGRELVVVLLGASNRDELYRQATRLMDQAFALRSNAWMLKG